MFDVIAMCANTANELTATMLVTKFRDVLSQRGKRRTDRRNLMELLAQLQQLVADQAEAAALSAALRVKFLFALIAALYDIHLNVLLPMSVDTWTKYDDFLLLIHTHIGTAKGGREDRENWF